MGPKHKKKLKDDIWEDDDDEGKHDPDSDEDYSDNYY